MENQSQVIEQLRKALQETGDKAKAELEAFKRESVTEIAILRSDVGQPGKNCIFIMLIGQLTSLQAAQHHQEISRLKRELQTAANNASNELQTKEKRIRQLERKVGHHNPKIARRHPGLTNDHGRSNLSVMKGQLKPGNSQKRSSTSAA